MKLNDFNLSSACLVAALLVGLILPSISQNNTLGNEFPSLVGLYSLLFAFYFVIVCIIPLPNFRGPASWSICCSLVSFPLIKLIWVLVTRRFRFPWLWRVYEPGFSRQVQEWDLQLEKLFSAASPAQHHSASWKRHSCSSAWTEELFRPVVSRQMFHWRKNRHLRF